MSERESLLKVRNLTVQYRSQPAPALNHISFELARGETIGLIGESGAGKTTLTRSLIRLLPADCLTNGSIWFRGTEILGAREKHLRSLRGRQISWIRQEPELALNPFMRVGRQIDEVLRAHTRWDRSKRRDEVLSMLAGVGLTDPRICRAYPHELSGGERQRIVIAQALILKPMLLIADEPTSSLDNVTQADILNLLTNLQKRLELGLLFITHNPALIFPFADRIIVMHAGNIVGSGSCHQIYRMPQQVCTRTPVEAILRPRTERNAGMIRGTADTRSAGTTMPVLEGKAVRKIYRRKVTAVQDVSLALRPASTLALVGKSGAGKSTLALCLAGLAIPDAGEIHFNGLNIVGLRRNELKRFRGNVQLIFQHSATALSPRLTALEIVAEPLRIQGIDANERRERALTIMKKVQIPEDWAARHPAALSGGQRQRLALARALVLNPKVLLLDEALAGLDVPAQMQIATLLKELQQELSLTYLFISHDLPMAVLLADTMAVMDRGRIVEMGCAADICSHPQCPITRELVASTPAFTPAAIPTRILSFT